MNRPSRRDVLRWAGLGAATLAAGCGDDLPGTPGDHHASAILEPEADSFLVAAWSSAATAFVLDVQAGDAPVHRRVIGLDRAGLGVADVGGLAPATRYQVMLVGDDGVRLGPHHVRTAPAPDDPRPVRLAVSADLDPSPEYASDLLDHLAAASPDVFVSLGDFPYTDNGPPATTLATYRERHVWTRTAPRVRAWLQTTGVRAIYDDHEFRNDWDAGRAAAEPARYAAAMQAWDEFFPTRTRGEIRYRAWRWGRHVACFLLDCRRFRSSNAAPDDDAKTMLGAAQLAWLIDGVRRSPATFKLVFTSVPLDFGWGDDAWPSFARERARLFDAVAGVPGVLFVSADQHWFAAHRHARGIREIQVGPLARGLPPLPSPSPGVLYRAARYNFALIDVAGDELAIAAIGEGGEVFYKETLSVADLTPSA